MNEPKTETPTEPWSQKLTLNVGPVCSSRAAPYECPVCCRGASGPEQKRHPPLTPYIERELIKRGIQFDSESDWPPRPKDKYMLAKKNGITNPAGECFGYVNKQPNFKRSPERRAHLANQGKYWEGPQR